MFSEFREVYIGFDLVTKHECVRFRDNSIKLFSEVTAFESNKALVKESVF